MGRWVRPRHRPSDAARHRLADAIRRNQAELEVQVAEGLLRSELYLETGQPERAAVVLEEQRERVREFERGLQRALASAAAEAEAEAVLAGADGVQVLHETPATYDGTRVPQLIAAAVAAIAAVGAMFASGAVDGADPLTASVRIDAVDRPSAGLDVSRPGAPEQLRFRTYGLDGTAEGVSVPPSDEALAREWLAQQETLLQRLGVKLSAARPGVLRDLEAVVARLIPGATLADEVWLRVLAESARAEPEQGSTEGATAEQPAAEEAGAGTEDDAPASDAPGSGSGWFGEADEDGSEDPRAPQPGSRGPTSHEPGDDDTTGDDTTGGDADGDETPVTSGSDPDGDAPDGGSTEGGGSDPSSPGLFASGS